MKFEALVIGLGNIGMLYDYNLNEDFVLSHCKALSIHKDFALSGGVEQNIKHQNLFKKKFNRPVFSSIAEALESIKPNIFIIATPSGSHFKIVNEVLEWTKPDLILCEKPLDYDLLDAENIVNLCNFVEVPLFVNYIRKSQESTNIIRDMINSKEISLPAKVNVFYTKGLLNNGSHFLNLLEFWFGNIQKVLFSKIEDFWDGSDHNIDFKVQFDNCIANFKSSSKNSRYPNSMEIFSSDGNLAYEDNGDKISWQNIQQSKGQHSDLNKYQLCVFDELSNFLNKRPYKLCSAEEALVTIRNSHKILLEAKK